MQWCRSKALIVEDFGFRYGRNRLPVQLLHQVYIT